MSTQILSLSDQGEYPFGESCDQNTSDSAQYQKVSVRQILSRQSFSETVGFSQLIKLARLTKKISSQTYMLIEARKILLFEEECQVHLIYEYVPIRIQKYISTMDEEFLMKYRFELQELAEFLAENRIITSIELRNMGLNAKYQLKYFLGVDFEQKKQVNIYELKNDYIEQIKLIFKPYIQSEQNKTRVLAQNNQKYVGKNLVRLDKRRSDAQEIENLSSRYMQGEAQNNKTRKHESIYFERSKPDMEIKQRKQSYMSSVSNLRLNNLYKRINEVELQVTNTKTPFQNKFKMAFENREVTSRSNLDNSISRNSNDNMSISRHRFDTESQNHQPYAEYSNQQQNSHHERKVSREILNGYSSSGKNAHQRAKANQRQLALQSNRYGKGGQSDSEEDKNNHHREEQIQRSEVETFEPKHHKGSLPHSFNGRFMQSQIRQNQTKRSKYKNSYNQTMDLQNSTSHFTHTPSPYHYRMHDSSNMSTKTASLMNSINLNQHRNLIDPTFTNANKMTPNPLMSFVSEALRVSGGSSKFQNSKSKLPLNDGKMSQKVTPKKKNKKIELFKQREYEEIKSTVNGEDGQEISYMKDFMNVLQGDGQQSIRMESSQQQYQSRTYKKPIDPPPAIMNSESEMRKYSEHNFNKFVSQQSTKTIQRGLESERGHTLKQAKSYQLVSKLNSWQQKYEGARHEANLQTRIKGAIQNSKRLIEQFRGKVQGQDMIKNKNRSKTLQIIDN